MNAPAPTPAPSLSDYDLQISTIQTLSLDAGTVDEYHDFLKALSVSILKHPDTGGEPAVVGEAQGVVVLSALAGDEGFEVRDVLDEYDGDLVEMYDELLEAGIELPSWEDLVVLSDVTIQPAHRLPGMEMALFHQLIRTAGAEMNVAVTYDHCLGLDHASRSNGIRRAKLPKGMRRVPQAGLVLWTGDRLSSVLLRDHLIRGAPVALRYG